MQDRNFKHNPSEYDVQPVHSSEAHALTLSVPVPILDLAVAPDGMVLVLMLLLVVIFRFLLLMMLMLTSIAVLVMILAATVVLTQEELSWPMLVWILAPVRAWALPQSPAMVLALGPL